MNFAQLLLFGYAAFLFFGLFMVILRAIVALAISAVERRRSEALFSQSLFLNETTG